MAYDIDEHRHRFAQWAAGRAASAAVGGRFTVQLGKDLLEEAGMRLLIGSPELLPTPEAMDGEHRKWRERVIAAAKMRGKTLPHGVAAKLINVYLKSAFVCGGHHEHTRVAALHPPIDFELLKALKKRKIGGLGHYWTSAAWSRFTSDEYEERIQTLRRVFPDKPLWMVEEYWEGYRQ